MINLSKSGNTIVFEFVNNGHYLQNGTIEVPVNSLTLVTDGSDMFTFKKSATNDIFVSGLYSEIGMTKSELESFYKENMVGSTGGSGGVTSGEVQSMIDESISGKADTSAVTEDISAAVSGKANKSAAYGSYAFGETNNQPYIRYKSVSNQNLGNEIYYANINGKGTLTNNKTWAQNNLNFQLVETSAFTAYTASTDATLSGKQDTLSAGTNITISGNVISAEGGGKAIEAGRGITVTTGETADTVSFSLPISANTNNNGLIIGKYNNEATAFASFAGGQGGNGVDHNIASGYGSFAFGCSCSATSINSIAMGGVCLSSGYGSFANGGMTTYGGGYVAALGDASHAEGNQTSATSYCSHSEGYEVLASNSYEHSQGRYNVSNKASTTFGDSGNTLFSVGNGTADNARHNAFEIRQNGDIYLSSGGTDIKLQDYLGGSSITVDTALDSGSTNPVENRVIYNKFDEVEDRIAEDEEVTAAALNALNDTIGNINSILESI